jgi:hypothetical protein
VKEIPPGQVWLLGDNQQNSLDSRSYGPVPLGLVVGRAFFKFGLNNPFLEYPYSEESDAVKLRRLEQANARRWQEAAAARARGSVPSEPTNGSSSNRVGEGSEDLQSASRQKAIDEGHASESF